tara:strand:+ start:6186 stop:6686 length:501 start_codon:yes stop_codon:yes gene_type:complete
MSTKYTLKELIDYGLVSDGDALTFSFKGHTFSTQLQRGGILAFCKWNDKPVFHDRSGFTSLTDWSDTCIQECLHEFVTRFSSWKRIKHAVTGTPMHMLRSRLWELRSATNGKKSHTSVADELIAERKRVVFLSQRVAILERELSHQRRVVPECKADTDDNPFRLRF